jgi:hypothetical protein
VDEDGLRLEEFGFLETALDSLQHFPDLGPRIARVLHHMKTNHPHGLRLWQQEV